LVWPGVLVCSSPAQRAPVLPSLIFTTQTRLLLRACHSPFLSTGFGFSFWADLGAGRSHLGPVVTLRLCSCFGLLSRSWSCPLLCLPSVRSESSLLAEFIKAPTFLQHCVSARSGCPYSAATALSEASGPPSPHHASSSPLQFVLSSLPSPSWADLIYSVILFLQS
jgi:hypothetical protein